MKQVTCVVTSLSTPALLEENNIGVSSLIDTWFQVRDIEITGERTRCLFLVESRGMGHSSQVREFLIRSGGVDLVPVAVGPHGALTGSARRDLELEQRAEARARQHAVESKNRSIQRKRKAIAAQIDSMRAEYDAEVAHALETQEREARLLESRARSAESGTSGCDASRRKS